MTKISPKRELRNANLMPYEANVINKQATAPAIPYAIRSLGVNYHEETRSENICERYNEHP